MIRLKEDGTQLLSTAIVFLILDAIAVISRLVAKSKTKSRFAFDDLYIVSAFIVYGAWVGLIIDSKQMMYDQISTNESRCS